MGGLKIGPERFGSVTKSPGENIILSARTLVKSFEGITLKVFPLIPNYLDGEFEFDDEYGEHFDREMQEDFRINMEELIDEKRSLQSKRNFLINSHRGVRITCFVREHLLQKVCDYFTLQCHRKRKCCEILKKRLNKINNKIEKSEDYEEKGSGESSDEEGESGGSSDGECDDKEDEDDSEEASSIEEESVEDVEAEGSNAEELDEKSEDESVRSTNDESSTQDGLVESSEDEDDSGIGEGYARKLNKDVMKRKIILDCGREKPLIWE